MASTVTTTTPKQGSVSADHAALVIRCGIELRRLSASQYGNRMECRP
jgi:hypothetical protein